MFLGVSQKASACRSKLIPDCYFCCVIVNNLPFVVRMRSQIFLRISLRKSFHVLSEDLDFFFLVFLLQEFFFFSEEPALGHSVNWALHERAKII